LIVEHGENVWCDDVTTDAEESCATINRRAFERALVFLESKYGADWLSWSWGKAHQAQAKHTPFSDVPLLSSWFGVSTPFGGDNMSINVGGYSMSNQKEPFAMGHGAGVRFIYDLADLDRSLFVLSTGQSGHLLSPHYRDASRRWAAGQYFPMKAHQRPEEANSLWTLVLEPERATRSASVP
jgi:penicillin amidase